MSNPKAEYLAKKGMLGMEAFDAVHAEPEKFAQMFPGIQVADAGMLGLDPVDRKAEMAAAMRGGAAAPSPQQALGKPSATGGVRVRDQSTADLNDRMMQTRRYSVDQVKEAERTGNYPELPEE